MSSARIDPPKRVLGLKGGVVTPPPIHGVNGFPLSVPVMSWLFVSRGKIPNEMFQVRPLADTRRSALAKLAAQAAHQQSTGATGNAPDTTQRAVLFQPLDPTFG
ncbi:unnamed protein product [Brassica napus]|uniref:(rape) hypothetical protein n=1 Tax=Brassica napus TaxID=3708 RepID=A0A816P322_BRANA|nr:unnamed protein product [Brassica napus]